MMMKPIYFLLSYMQKKMHEMLPACCHFASWQVTLIEKKKYWEFLLGISARIENI